MKSFFYNYPGYTIKQQLKKMNPTVEEIVADLRKYTSEQFIDMSKRSTRIIADWNIIIAKMETGVYDSFSLNRIEIRDNFAINKKIALAAKQYYYELKTEYSQAKKIECVCEEQLEVMRLRIQGVRTFQKVTVSLCIHYKSQKKLFKDAEINESTKRLQEAKARRDKKQKRRG